MGRDPPKELPVERPEVSCGSGESPSGSGPACWRKALPSERAELLAKKESDTTATKKRSRDLAKEEEISVRSEVCRAVKQKKLLGER